MSNPTGGYFLLLDFFFGIMQESFNIVNFVSFPDLWNWVFMMSVCTLLFYVCDIICN